jgi:23S rRNA (cytosine1962-C5)-methyltransferase
VSEGVEKPTGRVRLIRSREQALLSGYLWIFAGHIAEVSGEPAPGDLVEVCTYKGHLIGQGLFNPHSKIRVRMLTRADEPLNEDFWRRRIRRARAYRQRVVSNTSAYRLIHGESDLLPGLIVDCYGEVLVVQILSFGIERRREQLADLLLQETGATAVYLRNDAHARGLEGLPAERGFLRGNRETTIAVHEGLARFYVDIADGQKTGWYCDQRENRLAVAPLTRGATVLEAFCYTGAFGIQAALHGAQSVLGVDSNGEAIVRSREHAHENGVEARCTYREADVFDELRRLERAGERFDVVILDPPAFARTKEVVPQALAGYRQLNQRALRLLRPGGVLVSCSCSHYVSEESFGALLQEAAREAGRWIRLIERRSQARDHPVLAAMPETQYLKCFIVQAL